MSEKCNGFDSDGFPLKNSPWACDLDGKCKRCTQDVCPLDKYPEPPKVKSMKTHPAASKKLYGATQRKSKLDEQVSKLVDAMNLVDEAYRWFLETSWHRDAVEDCMAIQRHIGQLISDIHDIRKFKEENNNKTAKTRKGAEKKASEKDKRYRKYLELKAEFEDATKSLEKQPVNEAVYLCKYWEHDDDDPSGCGESWSWCHNEKSGRRECGCKRTYAMQFCPFFKKGKLAGKWVINDLDKEAAEHFKKQFEDTEDKVDD